MAFLLLAGILVFAFVFLFIMITSPVEQETPPEPEQLNGNVVTLVTTVNEFEAISTQYLKNELMDSPVPVDIEMNETIRLNSTLTVFGVDVPISMDFEPIVEEGNIRLKQREVNVGKLNIPPRSVLKLMKDSVEFPKLITILPNDEEIYVDLSRVNIANGTRVRAKEIDLPNDRIVLEMVILEEGQ